MWKEKVMSLNGRSNQTYHQIQLIFTFAVISTMLFTPLALGQDRNVEGLVQGVWSRDYSPYYVIGDIEVPNTGELYIQPGVEVIFLGNYIFEVRGLLLAEGDSTEGNRIRMTSELAIPWWGLSFNNCNIQSTVINCDIVNAWTGIDCINSFLRIERNRIDARNVGINCVASSPDIVDNRLISVSENNNPFASLRAINLHDGSSPRIEHNERIKCIAGAGGEAYGIYAQEYSSPLIKENWIEVISNTTAVGISISELNYLITERNIIRVSSVREMKGLETRDATGIEFFHNDVILYGTSLEFAAGLSIQSGSRITITNNIVLGNFHSIGLDASYGTVVQGSGYNDLCRHTENYRGDWQGNNDIYSDPLFVSENENSNEAYCLNKNSLCIDAGNPVFPNDPDGTICDIGRYWFIPPDDDTLRVDLSRTVADYKLLSAQPNPFNRTTILSFTPRSTGQGSLMLYDLRGRRLQTIWSGLLTSDMHRIPWQAMGCPAGEYIVRLESLGETGSFKLILLP